MRGFLQVISKQSWFQKQIKLPWGSCSSGSIQELLSQGFCQKPVLGLHHSHGGELHHDSWLQFPSCKEGKFNMGCDILLQLVGSILPLTLHLEEECGSCCSIISLYIVENGRERFVCIRSCWFMTNPVRKALILCEVSLKLFFWS